MFFCYYPEVFLKKLVDYSDVKTYFMENALKAHFDKLKMVRVFDEIS